jgi:hypothetical protein
MLEKTFASTLRVPRKTRRALWIALLWLVAAISVGGIALFVKAGWDTDVYWNAVQSVGRGGDPYADGIAAQLAYHRPDRPTEDDHILWTFVYSPLLLPLLRVLAWFPGWLLGALYGGAVVAGFLLQLWAACRLATVQERRWLVWLLPFAVFFPGLLNDYVILGGNIAFILYGLVLVAAVSGWQRNRWLWFYLAVLLASIAKAPMLTLLAFPLLVGKRQWLPASITGASGCLLFAAPAFLWPAQFKEFLLGISLQYEYSHGFGFSPSGVVGRWLWDMRRPYSSAFTITYLVWAIALGSLLLAVGSYVRRHPHLRELWIPVALVGTILMSPRLMDYDDTPLTIPLLLIAWRCLQLGGRHLARCKAGRNAASAQTQLQSLCGDASTLTLGIIGAGIFVAVNALDFLGGPRVPLELVVLLLGLSSGLWSLHRMGDTYSLEIPRELSSD